MKLPPATHRSLSPQRRFRQSTLSRAVRQVLSASGMSLLLGLQSPGWAAGFPASIELSDLDGVDGFVLNGVDSGDFSGRVSSAGDINGDGLDDLIIGANGSVSAGESYVVFGGVGVGSTGIINLSGLSGADGFVLNGVDAFDFAGRVSSAGDINGDGVDDLIIGAPYADPNGNSRAGESYVVFGGVGVGITGSINLSGLSGADGFVLNGVDANDLSGISVSGAGDLNGDGVDDLIIGAQSADPNGNNSAGESYVVFGGSGLGNAGVINLSDLTGLNGFVLNGVDAGDLSGESVSSGGDLNGDGVDDLIIGARSADPNGNSAAGKSYVVFGGSGLGSTGAIDLSDLNGLNGFVLNGIDVLDGSGGSVSSAGDINGDGMGDLIIGAPRGDPNGKTDAGESYVVFGGSLVGNTGVLDLSGLNGTDGFVLNGESAFDNSGGSVSSAGDINGDGIDDLIIGADDAEFDTGASYVVFGGSVVGSTGALNLSDLNGSNGFVLNGVGFGDGSGGSVSSAGDINGDGVGDVIIGARFSRNNAGQSYVVFGIAPKFCNGLQVTVDIKTGDLPTSGDDVILGTPDPDIINGLGGNDTICGEGGNDVISGGGGDDWIDGGEGNDQIRGNFGSDQLFGDVGDDEIRGGADDDLIEGEAGDDSLSGQGGNDTIDGGDGVDEIIGGGGNDMLFTGAGATVGTGIIVFGGSGSDTITGGPDADDLRGGNGDDIINGMGGNDFIGGGLGRDTADGGDGDDEIRGNGAVDTLSGGAGNDLIDGGSESDIINGNDGDDILIGGAGRDTLNGDAGIDTLFGGADDDTLDGGASAGDECNGNLGTDTATAECEVINTVP